MNQLGNKTMKFLILCSLLLSFSSHANSPNPGSSICNNLTEDIPIQAGGRVKPYYVLAKESVKFLTGKSKFEGAPQITTFCQIMFQEKLGVQMNFPILVEHVKTKKFLKMEEKQISMGSEEILVKKDLIRSEIFKQKLNDSYKKDLTKLFSRVDTYEKIKNGTAFTIYQSSENKDLETNWKPISQFKELSIQESEKLIASSKSQYTLDHGDDYLLELTYFKSNIFSIALLISLVGIFLTVLLKDLRYGVGVAFLTIIVEIVGMTLRVLVSGRAPITNMYETVMFSGFGALIMALGILYFNRDKVFLLAGLGYNILCLFMMMFANNMLSSSISPLVPVLRDNFWLSTHVTTIILSYAALALSWLVANITLIKMLRRKLTKKDYRYHQSLIYTCIKVGIILLAAGIILGGVWADYSWGRFWGWDPKETWSLIVLLFYMALVHGKNSNWVTTNRFVLASAGGFMTVMMAWFGVNYILASGLHSYGFSEGGAIFLGTFFAVQTAFLIFCALRVDFKQAG
jgi:cytochrome c-type biogenesis protein CcsB